MMITEEMIAEDEKRWHNRNIVAELGYCGKYVIHRNNITNDDIRFYAYIMRKAHAMLKEHEPIKPIINEYGGAYCICGENVGIIPDSNYLPSIRSKYCSGCGRRMKWDD